MQGKGNAHLVSNPGWASTARLFHMFCCQEFSNLVDREMARIAPMSALTNGRILTEIDTEYFLVFGQDRPSYVGVNYCPFCGRALSRQLWNLEKKKQ